MARLHALPYRTKLPKSVAPRQLESASDSWRAGKTTSQRGYDGKWQKYRLGFLRHNPLCVHCKENGIVEPATDVDHIVPHRGDMQVFWDKSNHQALCHRCHSLKTIEETRQSKTNKY